LIAAIFAAFTAILASFSAVLASISAILEVFAAIFAAFSAILAEFDAIMASTESLTTGFEKQRIMLEHLSDVLSLCRVLVEMGAAQSRTPLPQGRVVANVKVKASYYRDDPDGTDSIPITRQGVPAALREKFDAFMKSPKFMAAVRKNMLYVDGDGVWPHHLRCTSVKAAPSGVKVTFVHDPRAASDDVLTEEDLSDEIARNFATWGNAGDPFLQLKDRKATYFFVFEAADTVVTFGPSAPR
jgi:hypothetical protein